MDDFRFDALTRALSGHPTRRAALRLLAGSIVAGVFSRQGVAPARAAQFDDVGLEPGPRYTCVAQGLTDCFGFCVEVSSDPANCGACGNVCAVGDACIGGWCQTLAPGDTVGNIFADIAACAAGLTNCGGVCVDLSSDAGYCGGCFSSCVLGAICQGGVCVFVGCPAGLTYCESWGCVNLSTHAHTCGSCTRGCLGGYSCVNGQCE